MIKETIMTALLGLPITIPLGVAAYGLLRLLLERFRRIVQTGCVLTLVLLGAGILYGVLRFSGMIVFPNDNSCSVNWLNDSWRDDGFRYMYGCGTFVVAILAALHAEKKHPMTKE